MRRPSARCRSGAPARLVSAHAHAACRAPTEHRACAAPAARSPPPPRLPTAAGESCARAERAHHSPFRFQAPSAPGLAEERAVGVQCRGGGAVGARRRARAESQRAPAAPPRAPIGHRPAASRRRGVAARARRACRACVRPLVRACVLALGGGGGAA